MNAPCSPRGAGGEETQRRLQQVSARLDVRQPREARGADDVPQRVARVEGLHRGALAAPREEAERKHGQRERQEANLIVGAAGESLHNHAQSTHAANLCAGGGGREEHDADGGRERGERRHASVELAHRVAVSHDAVGEQRTHCVATGILNK